MLRYVVLAAIVLLALPTTGRAQTPTVTPFMLNRTVDHLPDGPLYWRLQTFPTRTEAEEVAGPTGQVGEAEGAVWLFTLGAKGGAPAGGMLIDEIGPLAVPPADAYLLRNSYTTTPPGMAGGGGSVVHSHPGTEAFYLLAGEQTVFTPGQVVRTGAGQSQVGVPPETPVVVLSTGTEPRRAFTLFVVDASKPFSSPAVFLETAATPAGPAGPPAPVTTARDGLTLTTQSAATQALFRAVWGQQAAARWTQEHDAELARQGR